MADTIYGSAFTELWIGMNSRHDITQMILQLEEGGMEMESLYPMFVREHAVAQQI